MIKINNLNFKYDKRIVLKDINLEILENEFVVITGGNGSGKSTLIKCLLGINNIKEDSILIEGEDVNSALKDRLIGYVPQLDNNKFPIPITVREYLSLIGNKKRIDELSKKLGFCDILDSNVNYLSGGQRQILNIIKAIIHPVKYLILDEPNSGLDFNNRKKLYELLNGINKDGITIIIVSHYLDEISCKVNKIFNVESNTLEEVNIDGCEYC